MDTRTAQTGSRNRLLAALLAADQSLLERSFETLPIKQGVVLQEAGQAIERVYFPHQGMVSLLAVMSDGRAIETATVGSEGAIGAMSGFGARLSFTRAVVQAPVTVSQIPSRQFRKAVEASAALRNVLVSYNEALLAQIQQTAACNALHPLESRLARWLLQTRDRTESDTLPLTQEFLSQMLGVRRSTVTVVAQQLERAGVIRQRRGRIEIADRQGLEKVACECYGIVLAQLSAVLPQSSEP